MKLRTALFTAIAFTFPISVFANTTLTFQGEVTSQTCKATINGQTNSTILLPTVSTAELSTAGAKAGLTPFTINIADCQSDAADLNVTTKFLGHNVTSNGNLGNTATTNPAQNLAIQLTADAGGSTPIVLNGVTSATGLVLSANETTATHQFAAQYYAEGPVTAGSITAIVEYTLSYN